MECKWRIQFTHEASHGDLAGEVQRNASDVIPRLQFFDESVTRIRNAFVQEMRVGGAALRFLSPALLRHLLGPAMNTVVDKVVLDVVECSLREVNSFVSFVHGAFGCRSLTFLSPRLSPCRPFVELLSATDDYDCVRLDTSARNCQMPCCWPHNSVSGHYISCPATGSRQVPESRKIDHCSAGPSPWGGTHSSQTFSCLVRLGLTLFTLISVSLGHSWGFFSGYRDRDGDRNIVRDETEIGFLRSRD